MGHWITELFSPSLKEPWFFTELSFLLTFAFFLCLYSTLGAFRKVRLLSVVLFSLFFYYKSSGWYILIFLLVILSDFLWAIAIDRENKKSRKKIYLTISILFSASFLLYFKYTYFFLDSLSVFGLRTPRPESLFLPIGISFYTFQSISYLVDVYKGIVAAERSPLNYFFYMTFFPHLVAGPIVRGADFLPQLKAEPDTSALRLKEGFIRVLIGLGKKLIIADYLAKYVDIVNANAAGFSGLEVFFSAVSYSLQIYFDFSGYSDIAIGIAMILGYELKENFSAPYTAGNITVFWRKWHMSLSSWLKDYIYIPLGGNRKGLSRSFVFILITMLIGGLWHGADWKFVLWGALHGLALVIHKQWTRFAPSRLTNGIPHALSIVITFLFVTFCWIFFRAGSSADAMVQIEKILFSFDIREIALFYQNRSYLLWMIVLGMVYVYTVDMHFEKAVSHMKRLPLVLLSFLFLLILQLALQVRQEDVQPFIYFQF
jgi:D-alanyl-lipoteichoic acid acyltransferase DltB (MBOAT superfamily)